MFRTMIGKLAATTVLVVVGLAPSMVTPAYADPAYAGSGESTKSNTTVITAGSVADARDAVSKVLSANDASRYWPAVDADLTPKLESTAAAGGGTLRTEVIGLPIKIVIKCEITFPPLKIRCTVDIIIDL